MKQSIIVALLVGTISAQGEAEMPPPEYFWKQVQDKEGGMTPDEFFSGYREVDPNAGEDDIWGAFKHGDRNEDWRLSEDEFFALFDQAGRDGDHHGDDHHGDDMPSADELWGKFADGEGGISEESFWKMVYTIDESPDVEEVHQAWMSADWDQNGHLNHEEFNYLYHMANEGEGGHDGERRHEGEGRHDGGRGGRGGRGDHGGMGGGNMLEEYFMGLQGMIEMEVQRRVAEALNNQMGGAHCLQWADEGHGDDGHWDHDNHWDEGEDHWRGDDNHWEGDDNHWEGDDNHWEGDDHHWEGDDNNWGRDDAFTVEEPNWEDHHWDDGDHTDFHVDDGADWNFPDAEWDRAPESDWNQDGFDNQMREFDRQMGDFDTAMGDFDRQMENFNNMGGRGGQGGQEGGRGGRGGSGGRGGW